MRKTKGLLFAAAGIALVLSPACVEADRPGQLDATFINGVRSLADFTAIAVATEPLGTVYVLGTASNCVSASSGQDFAVVHYLIDGTLDVYFGSLGEACVDFGSSVETPRWIGVDGQTRKVWVAGSAGDTATNGVIARLLLTGEQDSTFGDGGFVTLTDPASYVASVAFVASGIVAAEVSTQTATTATLLALDNSGAVTGAPNHVQVPAQAAAPVGMASDGTALLIAQSASATPGAHAGFALTNVSASGTLAGSFGAGGTAYASLSATGADVAEAVVVQSNAEIVAAGPVAVAGADGFFDIGLARWKPTGAGDGTYVAGPSGSGVTRIGNVQWRLGQQSSGLAVQPDDSLLLAGSAPSGNTAGGRDAVVERLTSDARVDATYATNGTWTSGIAGDDYVVGAALDFSGKLVVLALGTQPDTYYLYRLDP